MTEPGVAAGFDTSNYTTSVCAVASTGEILFEERRLLRVPAGGRGLMQSEALFQHVEQLSGMAERLGEAIRGRRLLAAGASVRPRPVEGSYMPVFRAGELAAAAFAAGGGAPLVRTSHQAGHIAAGLATSGFTGSVEPFAVLHLSGGTTDILLARRRGYDFDLEPLASGTDLHVGQFVDRAGVALGLPFPAGPHLESLASRWTGPVPTVPSSVKDGRPSFSGPLAAAERMIRAGVAPEAVAAAVQRAIAASAEKMIRWVLEKTGAGGVLLVGGVASNRAVRERLTARFGGPGRASRTVFFCDPRYSSDNALGVARIALASAGSRGVAGAGEGTASPKGSMDAEKSL